MGTNKTSFDAVDPENGEVYTINLTSLVSQVRELFLSRLRNDREKKTWSKMNQAEQQREIDTCDDLSRSIVLAVANLVSAGNNPVIHALLDNYKVKAGEVTVTAKGMANDAAVLALNHVGKKALKIIVVDESQYDQEGDKTEAEPDQPSLLDGEQPDAEDDDGPSLADAMHDAIDQDQDQDQDQENADTDGESTDENTDSDDTANDLQPYEHGAGAAEHGLDVSANPFKGGTDDYSHWRRGFNDWHDANPSDVVEEPETETKEIGPEETDESGVAELFDAVETEDPAPAEDDGPVIEHEETEQLDLVTIKKDGGQARVDGLGMDECPFDGGTEAYEAWAKGWRATDDQIDGLMEEGAAARRDGSSAKKCPWKAGSKENGYWMIGYNRAKSEETD